MMINRSYNVVNAEYLGGYLIDITFEDNHKIKIDFTNALQKYAVGAFEKYKVLTNFKKYKIDHGNLVWGKDWDLFFPPDKLYSGRI